MTEKPFEPSTVTKPIQLLAAWLIGLILINGSFLGARLPVPGTKDSGGPGHTPLGWVHPDLGLGFEVVSSSLLDGRADRTRVRRIRLPPDGEIALLAVEDMIADRMGQYASGSAPDMLGQARTLYALHADADPDYLERRIREETLGEHGIASLET